MARRHKLWAARERKRLAGILGGECVLCGSLDSLQFDCISPQGDWHHRRSAPERICFYRRQMRAGNIQLLCGTCNSLKSEMPVALWKAALRDVHARTRSAGGLWTPAQGTKVDPLVAQELFRTWLDYFGVF